MKATRIVAYLALSCLVFCLSGCEKKWNFTVLNADKNNPQFCISSGKNCTGDGVQLALVVIQEVDGKGALGRQMWMIQGRSGNAIDYQIKRLTYGVVPTGWAEYRPAEKLINGVYYSVNEEFYFMRQEQGGYIVLTREEFFRNLLR